MHKVSKMKTLGVPPTLGMNKKAVGVGKTPVLPKRSKKKGK